jgi:hypothetical protein
MVIVILGIAAVAAAMWDRYAPPTACLLCAGPEHYETALNATPDAVGTTGAAEAARRGQYAAANPSTIPPPGFGASDPRASSSQRGDARRSWTPWGIGTGAHGYGSSDTSGPSVGLGGLWRLNTLGHRPAEPAAASAPRATRVAQTAASRPAPKPPRTGAPGPRPAPAPPIVAPVATVITPTNPFTGFAAGPSDPFQPPPPAGSLDPGGPGGPGGVGTSGGGTSATPEPASLLLIGTGLLVLAGELRRRRVI